MGHQGISMDSQITHCEGIKVRCPRSGGRQIAPEFRGGSGREISSGRWNLIHPPKDGQDLSKYRQGGRYSLAA